MTKEELNKLIKLNYKTNKAFIQDFNKNVKFNALEDVTLSRQLSGKVCISRPWRAAYFFFFFTLNSKQ